MSDDWFGLCWAFFMKSLYVKHPFHLSLPVLNVLVDVLFGVVVQGEGISCYDNGEKT
ncbi:hypothetical protein [Paraburkholderia sediminicola]|uniref:hypothetical protein n=1 Tax=Paraburkholderia sediminicola TaxID=458836 RepID=UPI0038BDCC67